MQYVYQQPLKAVDVASPYNQLSLWRLASLI